MPDPLDAKIHPRRKPRMQSSGTAGDSSSTSRRCGPGQPGSQRRRRRGKEKRGDSPIRPEATPRDLSFRATWKLALRRARGKTNRGNPANSTEGKSGRRQYPGKLGETTRRSRKIGKAGRPASRLSAIPKDRKRGQLRGRAVGTAEACEGRGNSKLHRRQSRRCRTKGNRRLASEARHGGVGNWGNPDPHKTSFAEVKEIRGDSKINRRHGQRKRMRGNSRIHRRNGQRMRGGATCERIAG